MRRSIRYLLILTGCVGVAFGVYVALVLNRLDDAYAQWGAADMVMDYLDDHDGQWPEGWNDLKPYFDAGGSRVSGWSYDEFQRYVWIDFSADPDELRKLSQTAEAPPFNVIDSTSVFGPQFDDGPKVAPNIAGVGSGFRGVDITRILQPSRSRCGQYNIPQIWARGPAFTTVQSLLSAYRIASRMCLFG